MSKWRFLKLFAIAIILSISFACTQTITGEVKVTETLAERSPLIQPENKPTAAPLPPETAAIVASVGSKDLFTPPRGDVRIAVISDLNGVYGATDYEPEVDKAIALLPFGNQIWCCAVAIWLRVKIPLLLLRKLKQCGQLSTTT